MSRALVGLDIGYRHLRGISLQPAKGGGYTVAATAEVARFDDMGERKPLARALAEIDSRLSMRGEVTVACSDLATMVRFEHNDPIPPDRLERLLRLELSQHATGDDLAADVVTVPVGGDELIHCCGLAQPPQVVGLIEEMRKVGIRLDRMQLAPAAGANCQLIEEGPAEDATPEDEGEDEIVLTIDIGARATRLQLTRGQDFLACRQLAFGGDSFTEALARARNLRFEQAEQLKCSGGGHHPLESAPTAEPGAGDGDDLIDFDESGDIDAKPLPPELAASADEAQAEAEAGNVTGPEKTPPPDTESSGGGLTLDGDRPLFLEEATPAAVSPASAPTPVASAPDNTDFPQFLDDTAPAGDTPVPASPSPSGNGETSSDRRSILTALDDEEPPAAGVRTVTIATSQLGPELAQVAEQLYQQAAKTMTWFQAQLRQRRLEVGRVRLVGGGAGLDGLATFLQRRFKVPVAVADPFAPLVGNLPDKGYEFHLALGLALTADPRAVRFDLQPESLQRRRAFRRELVWPWVAAALVLIGVVVAGVAMIYEQAHGEDILAVYREYQERHQQLENQLDKAKKEHAGIRADMREVASRLYGGRDLLYTLRALKENAPQELWLVRLTTHGLQGGNESEEDGRGRSRGRDRGRTTQAGASDRAATIDRGHIYVEGYIKPAPGKDITTAHREYLDWRGEVETWLRPVDNSPLFRDERPDQFINSEEDGVQETFFSNWFFFSSTELTPVERRRD